MANIELKIGGANESPEMIRDWATKAVSLLGKKDAHRVPCQGKHHLVMFFDDTQVHNDPKWQAASPWHIARVLEHTADLKDGDKLWVNCKAGKSRSTAMAIGIMIQQGMSPAQAFLHVKEIREVPPLGILPNQLLIQFIDEHFGLGGELIDIVSEYYDGLAAAAPDIKLPDRGGWNL